MRSALESFVCHGCGETWPENYCPQCGQTINRALISHRPPQTTLPAGNTFGKGRRLDLESGKEARDASLRSRRLKHPLTKFVLRFAVSFAVLAALVSLVLTIPIRMDFHLNPHGKASDFLFSSFMLVIGPAMTLGRFIGLSGGMNPWLGYILVVMINTLLGFLLGALVGVAAWVAFKSGPITNATRV